MTSTYRPADLRTALPTGKLTGLRSKARALAPEPFDPGTVVRQGLYAGVVWSLGPPGRDSRWVVCEDGTMRVLLLAKDKGTGEVTATGWEQLPWGIGSEPAYYAPVREYVPASPQPFSVSDFETAPAEQPSIFDLAA